MLVDDLPPRHVLHVFTTEDRERQLSDLAVACEQLVNHDEPWHASTFGVRASHARRLLDEGFSKDDLVSLDGRS